LTWRFSTTQRLNVGTGAGDQAEITLSCPNGGRQLDVVRGEIVSGSLVLPTEAHLIIENIEVAGTVTNRILCDAKRAIASPFVGRSAGRALFRGMLGPGPSARVLYVHGPGGIGKTAFLAELRRICQQSDVVAAALDGRHLEPTVEQFVASLGRSLALPPGSSPLEALAAAPEQRVLLLDTCDGLSEPDPPPDVVGALVRPRRRDTEPRASRGARGLRHRAGTDGVAAGVSPRPTRRARRTPCRGTPTGGRPSRASNR
jgi:hypothetical protein